MLNKTDSAYAEYKYNFSIVEKKSLLQKKFTSLLSVATRYSLLEEFTELILNSQWSSLNGKLTQLLNYEIHRPDKSEHTSLFTKEITQAQAEINDLSITSFIELDSSFREHSEKALAALLDWSAKHKYIYTNEFGVITDIEEYFLRSHNFFTGENWNLSIEDLKTTMPTGEVLYAYNPSKEEAVILETALYDIDREIDFASIVAQINSIEPSKLASLSNLTAVFTYDAWVFDPLDFVKTLVQLQTYTHQEILALTQALEVLVREWDTHGEELIKSATKLIIK